MDAVTVGTGEFVRSFVHRRTFEPHTGIKSGRFAFGGVVAGSKAVIKDDTINNHVKSFGCIHRRLCQFDVEDALCAGFFIVVFIFGLEHGLELQRITL